MADKKVSKRLDKKDHSGMNVAAKAVKWAGTIIASAAVIIPGVKKVASSIPKLIKKL